MKFFMASALLAYGMMSSPALGAMFFNAQHAGYAGQAAMGLGYAGSNFGADVLCGWTPSRLAGHEVRSITVKGLWYLFSVGHEASAHVRPYLGLGAIYSPDDELFVRLPDQYPAGYYVPSALRPTLLTGLRFQVNPGLGVSLEYVLMDSELAFVKDKGGVSYNQVGSFGFGLHYSIAAD